VRAPSTTYKWTTLPGRQTPTKLGKQARATVCQGNVFTVCTEHGKCYSKDSQMPRSWDELASKFDLNFASLFRWVETMRSELDDAKRRARQLEHRLRQEVIGNA